jgi:signal transduction histidine kinase
MGGTAWVQDRIGGGARFVVELPERVPATGAPS